MFARQLHNPLLLVLLVTAAVLRAVGDLTGALAIGAIMAMSVGLSFFWSTLLASV
jgi:hypothetical protein